MAEKVRMDVERISEVVKLKLHVLYIRPVHKTAKNRGEPQKMTPSLETEFFLGGGSNGKVVAPGIVVICSIDKNRDHYTKN